jgi:predicted transcriptional regulator
MSKTVKVATGSVDAFFKRSLERACKLDSGDKLAEEIRVTFEDPSDLVKVLTPERIRVLREVRFKPSPLSILAVKLKRDRTAVKRDVKVLTSSGLVKTHEEVNPGHGLQKVIEPLAKKYTLTATI